jgi:hypothetical protein
MNSLSSSSLKTFGFKKTELENFVSKLSKKKTSVHLNIVGIPFIWSTESQILGSKVSLEPTHFSVW